jgi:hypothetical protein
MLRNLRTKIAVTPDGPIKSPVYSYNTRLTVFRVTDSERLKAWVVVLRATPMFSRSFTIELVKREINHNDLLPRSKQIVTASNTTVPVTDCPDGNARSRGVKPKHILKVRTVLSFDASQDSVRILAWWRLYGVTR